MNSPAILELSSAGQFLENMQSGLKTHGISGVIQKVDISRTGGIQFELQDDGSSRWYKWEQQKPVELHPANDRKIPLAALLKDPQFVTTASVLSYRAGKRLTLMDSHSSKAHILKGFRRGYLDPMICRYETAHQAFSGRGVNTPEIIEYEHENQSLRMVYQPGERLHLSADTTDLFYLVGEALRGFQEYQTVGDETCFDSGAELEVIDQRAARLQHATGTLPKNWTQLRRRIETAWRRLPEPLIGLAHRDLHDKQFIQHGNFTVLLDFDLMCRADVCLDPANFLAHLVLRNLQGVSGATQRSIDACGKQLLLGLGRNGQAGFWHRLRFYQATSFCRLALVYCLRPAWQHLVPALVTMGNRCLDDFDHIETR